MGDTDDIRKRAEKAVLARRKYGPDEGAQFVADVEAMIPNIILADAQARESAERAENDERRRQYELRRQAKNELDRYNYGGGVISEEAIRRKMEEIEDFYHQYDGYR